MIYSLLMVALSLGMGIWLLTDFCFWKVDLLKSFLAVGCIWASGMLLGSMDALPSLSRWIKSKR